MNLSEYIKNLQEILTNNGDMLVVRPGHSDGTDYSDVHGNNDIVHLHKYTKYSWSGQYHEPYSGDMAKYNEGEELKDVVLI